MEEEYEIKHTAFGDIKVKKSKPYEEPDTFDPSLQSQGSVVVEEEEEEEQAYDFFSAVGAHFTDDKEGTCMLAFYYYNRDTARDKHIAFQLCRQLNEYRESQPLLMELENMELPESEKPYDDLDENGHSDMLDLMVYAYSCALTGDAEWALWCAHRMRRKPFSRFADEDKLLSLFKTAAEELLEGKLECARIYAGRHDWGEAVEWYDKAFEQQPNKESAAALAKAFDIGRGYQASEKNMRYYAYEWAKLDPKNQEFIFSHYYPEEHQLYLQGLEAYNSNDTDRYNDLMVKASNGYHLMAHTHHSISQVKAAFEWAHYEDKDRKLNPEVGEEIVNDKRFIEGHDHLKWLSENRAIADWKGYMVLGICEVMTYAFQERHDFILASHAFHMADMPICGTIFDMAGIMQETNESQATRQLQMSLKVRWLFAISETCYYQATSMMAETVLGLALHRYREYLNDDWSQVPYEDHLMKYHDPAENPSNTVSLYIQKIIMTSLLADDKVIRDYPPCCDEEERGRLLRGGKIKSSKEGQCLIAYTIWQSFLFNIFDVFEEDFEKAPAEMADCQLAGILLGITNFHAYAAAEYHRLHLHPKTASRLASLSHCLMGFAPDHRYHHYTLF